MRRRILILVLATTSFALVLMSVLLMSVIWGSTASSAQDRVEGTADLTAAAVEVAVEADPAAEAASPGTGVGASTVATVQGLIDALAFNSKTVITVVLPDGQTVSSGTTTGEVWTATTTNAGVTVTAEIEVADKVRSVALQGAIVVAVSLVAISIAMAVAWFYTRRLMRPFDDFRDFIATVATGDRRRLKQRYGVPEIDMVADVLDAGISRFDDAIERERQATQDASHQLKSPLTAISLRLDEIMATDSLDVAHDEAVAALSQVERLTGVVDDVVGVMTGQRSSSPVDVAIMAVVDEQVEEWAGSFRAAGREILVSGRADVVVNAERGALAQVLATLMENSLAHGAGPTTLRVRRTNGWAVLEVGDRGEGIPPELVDRVFERSVSGGRSSGLGLSVARTLVTADGGRLELLSARPAVFAVFLPAVGTASSSRGDEEEEVPGAALSAGGDGGAEDQAVVATAASSAVSGSAGNTNFR